MSTFETHFNPDDEPTPRSYGDFRSQEIADITRDMAIKELAQDPNTEILKAQQQSSKGLKMNAGMS